MRAAWETEELVEAAAHGMTLGFEAEVPFADEAGLVARGFEPLGENRFAQRQPDVFVRHEHGAGIELVSETLLVATRQERRPRRAAIGAADVTMGKANAVLRQRIKLRCGDVFA